MQENKRLDSGNYAKARRHSDRREESRSPLKTETSCFAFAPSEPLSRR